MPQQTLKARSVRPERRFRPGAEETQTGLGSISRLESRQLLSHSAHGIQVAAQAHPGAHTAHQTQADVIIDAYNTFKANFLAHATTSESPDASIFNPSYIVNSTNLMAIGLVRDLNSRPLSLKFPYLNAPPHTPNNRGAIQTFIYDSIAGSSPTSLQSSLLSIDLPTTANNTLYTDTVTAAIDQSLNQTLNGVTQIYAKHLYISAPQPNNRFGVIAPKTIPSYYLTP